MCIQTPPLQICTKPLLSLNTVNLLLELTFASAPGLTLTFQKLKGILVCEFMLSWAFLLLSGNGRNHLLVGAFLHAREIMAALWFCSHGAWREAGFQLLALSFYDEMPWNLQKILSLSVVFKHRDISLVSLSQTVLVRYGSCRQKIAGVSRGCEAPRCDNAMAVLMVVHAGDDLPVHDWEGFFVLVKKL